MSQEEREPRLFDRQEAEQLLPLLERLLGAARQRKQQVDEVNHEFSQIQNRILLYGGILPPYGYLAEKKTELDALIGALRQVVSQIENEGCLLKDLDLGLIDFPCVLNDEQVLLCWKSGEERILYWHRPEEGFAGRKPLQDTDDSKPN